jgi:hypothetical protein
MLARRQGRKVAKEYCDDARWSATIVLMIKLRSDGCMEGQRIERLIEPAFVQATFWLCC